MSQMAPRILGTLMLLTSACLTKRPSFMAPDNFVAFSPLPMCAEPYVSGLSQISAFTLWFPAFAPSSFGLHRFSHEMRFDRQNRR